ncbi:MAG: hypothetical protein PHO75_04380, partial [Candidatus Shapirobacteria bacterium]|nr:hypothetical protein [Candidatus Shapirobacteria bacterium]
YTTTLSSDLLTAHTNRVDVIAVDDEMTQATDYDTETVNFEDVAPTIDVTKTADDTSIPETGQSVTFTYRITNTGAEDVTVTSIIDDKFGDLLATAKAQNGGANIVILATNPDSYYEFTYTTTLSSDLLTAHTNRVDVIAVDDEMTQATDYDTETVNFEDVLPSVTIEKSVDSLVAVEPGGIFTYILKITNNSKEDVVITSLTDTNVLSSMCLGLIGTTIAPNDYKQCSYTLFHSVAGTYDNTAYVLVTDNDGSTASDDDSASVKVIGVRISFNDLTATNDINDPHIFTVKVEQNPGDGWVPYSSGPVHFTLINNTAGASFVGGVNTCTTDINGECDVQINSVSPGTVQVHAEITAWVLGRRINRQTDGTLSSSINATKTYEAGKIIIKKETLPDGNTTQSFQFNPSWRESNFSLKDGESKDSGWLAPGTYDIIEIGQTGWDLTNVTCNDQNIGDRFVSSLDFNPNPSIILDPGEVVTCTFTNTQRGSVEVTKFEDANGNKEFDEGEEKINGWEINLSSQASKTTGSQQMGQVLFDQLLPNTTYYLSETMQTGWTQTVIYCHKEDEIDNDNSHEINLSAGQNLICFIGNQPLNPQLTIAKSNDAEGEDRTPGSSVGFKIRVTVLNNDIDDLIVTDLPSDGFVYRPGSYSVLRNGQTYPITEPEYHSPGVWNLGNLSVGDTIELSYLADIDSDQQPGLYKDLAYARGVAAYDNTVQVIATSEEMGYVNNNLVGTEVPIVKSTQNSVSAGVEREVEGEVLGASTELPATGASIIWLIISALMSLIGLAFIKKSTFKFATLLFLTIFSLFFVGGVKAIDIDSLSVRLEQPKSPTNINDLKLTFVALDLDNKAITVKCFKKGPSDSGYSQFGADIPLDAPGDTSRCKTNSSILNTEGPYLFYVTANGEESNIVSLDYKTSGPGTPSDYRKEWLNGGCDYKIHFKTADDGGKTVKVELYRADITDFILDSGSRVASVSIGSNQESTITNTVPDCSKSYYYVLRAFDDAGNGSGTIGDTVTITKTSTTVGTTTTSGAIPVTNATISPEEESTLLTGTPAPEDLATDNEEGTVLGTIDSVKSFLQKSWLPLGLGLIGLFAIIRYALKKKKRSSYR